MDYENDILVTNRVMEAISLHDASMLLGASLLRVGPDGKWEWHDFRILHQSPHTSFKVPQLEPGDIIELRYTPYRGETVNKEYRQILEDRGNVLKTRLVDEDDLLDSIIPPLPPKIDLSSVPIEDLLEEIRRRSC